MAVIFYDFEYANEKDVETSLWTAHVSFNSEYRQILMRIGAQKQVVLKRKVDKSYRDFLKTSQDFYLGYIQRLAGRFWIPELLQAARGLNTEPLGSPQREAPPSSALRAKIINSCYLTLVRLGDLARYRCQASEKPSKASFDIALTYYGLANMLDPNDGASHHQTAVLYQPSGQHLEIIYYFHRSVCVAKPHKLGAGNLARAFKSLLESQPGAKAGAKNVASKNASETLATWFLRLHAYYSQGELFSAQDELEKEVLHRIKMCLKAEGNDKLVLKMLLINIAAYDLALDNIKCEYKHKRFRVS
jgi:protein SMG7